MADISTIYRGPDDGGNYAGEWANEETSYYLISDVGRKREHNEDSCILCVPDDEAVRERRGVVLAVADGMGGASAGEYASRLTLTELIRHYYDNDSDSIPDALQLAIKKANSQVFEESEADPELQGMGTTCSAVVLHGINAYIGQVGDSRGYAGECEVLLEERRHSDQTITESTANSRSIPMCGVGGLPLSKCFPVMCTGRMDAKRWKSWSTS